MQSTFESSYRILSEEQREKLYQKKIKLQLDFNELATILNAEAKDLIQAQIGKPIPEEVEEAILVWIE